MQKVEGSNPFSRSPKSLAFAGLSAPWAGPPDARVGHFPRLLSLHCLNRGFLAPPGGPHVRAILLPETASTPPPGRTRSGRWGPSAARRASCRAGCGARAPKGARRPRRPCNPAPARAARSALAKTYRNTEAHKRLLAKLKDLLGSLGCHKTSIPRWSVLSQQVPLAGIAHNCGTVRFW
jgi:hypothetical protein